MIAQIKKLLLLLALFLLVGCDKKNDFSSFLDGSLVATFRCEGIDLDGKGTGYLTKRGFLILLENKADSMIIFNFPENEFNFPHKILEANYDFNNCGPIYFTDELNYKIRFKYRNITESENIKFVCGSCTLMEQSFKWEAYRQVIIKEIIKW